MSKGRDTGAPPTVESVRSLLTAGAVMAAGVLVCIVRAPKPLDTSDGLSWFGVTGDTLVEYGLTMLVTAALIVRAAVPMRAVAGLRPLRLGLLATAALMPVMLATPYTLNPAMNWIHMSVGSVLFVLQILVAAWLWWAWARTWPVFLLLAAQVLGGVVCFTALVDLDTAMLYGQLVFQVAFTVCIALGVATGHVRAESGRRPSARRAASA